MIKLKLYFAGVLNKYVNWSCNLNYKLIAIQKKIHEEVMAELKNEEVKEDV